MIVHSYKEKSQRDQVFENGMSHWAHKQKVDLTGAPPFDVRLKNYDEDQDLVGEVGSAAITFPYLIVAWT